jgi:hypothetical protein
MEDRRTRTDGAKKRRSESGGVFSALVAPESRPAGFLVRQVACRFSGAWGKAPRRVESCGVNELNFNNLPRLGRSLSKAVQGSEGNRWSLPSLGRHVQHDFQGLEDGDKTDTRAVREAVSTMTVCRGLIVNAVGVNVSGGDDGGAVVRRNAFLLFARARIGIGSLLRRPEPPGGGE